jgi:hypothetical protein
MKDIWIRRTGWEIALLASICLIVSGIMLYLAPDHTSFNWLENQVKAIVTIGAPILGVIILNRQPRHRIGWLWIVYGMTIGFRTLGHAIYYYNGSQFSGYSALAYFFLWSTEPANLAGFACLILLMLWFPDGELPSRRWRFLYAWLFLAIVVMFSGLFHPGKNWNGVVETGIVINNPYGWVTADIPTYIGLLSFISIFVIMLLAAFSLVLRYRSARQLVRLQLRWFVLGGFLMVIFDLLPIFWIGQTHMHGGVDLLVGAISFSYIVPLYLAVGIAILRYRLYDIDVIIRRTLQYTLLTGSLALVYLGGVVLLQGIFERIAGKRESALVTVISTLAIVALFNPLRKRIQNFINRRFYRSKYNAELALAHFAAIVRDEVDMETLITALLEVVNETLQPEKVKVWLVDAE